MTEKIKVLNTFREKEHDDHIYEEGQMYPAKGYKATKKRVEFLQKANKDFDNKIFLETPKQEEKPKDEKKESGEKSDDKK